MLRFGGLLIQWCFLLPVLFETFVRRLNVVIGNLIGFLLKSIKQNAGFTFPRIKQSIDVRVLFNPNRPNASPHLFDLGSRDTRARRAPSFAKLLDMVKNFGKKCLYFVI